MANQIVSSNKIGLVLVNLGTPDSPETPDVKKYLRQFLSDPRVIESPKFIWWFILNGGILPYRSSKSAEKYQTVWQHEGSPIRLLGESLVKKLSDTLDSQKFQVKLAMTYGQPAIGDVISQLLAEGIEDIRVIPLYPQYSATTTAPVYDQIGKFLQSQRNLPSLRILRNYCDDKNYHVAMANCIRQHWETEGKGEKLIFSYHGIPKKYADKGDPYPQECYRTSLGIAKQLNLQKNEWETCFQSRFGPAEWLQPYLSDRMSQLPAENIKKIDVVAPSFACDCLETLEEIKMEAQEMFLAAGGEEFRYVEALNDSDLHVDLIIQLLQQRLS